MAKEAERLLEAPAGSLSRCASPETNLADTTDGEAEDDDEALPAFLADDEESTSDEEADEPAVIAAE